MDILTDQDMDKYITGPLSVKPTGTTTPEEMDKWERGTRKALSSIRLRVGESPMAYIRRSTEAKEAWDKLQSIYQPRGALTIVHLRRKIFGARCDEGVEIESHIRTLTDVRDELASYGKIVEESEFAACIITSLPDSWDNWISGIEISKITDSSDIIARIIQQEQRLKAKPNSDETALAAYPKRESRSRSNNDATKNCYHCGRPNHFSNECRDKAAGKTFTEREKKENYDRFKRFKGKKGGGKAKANVAKEAPVSDDDDFALTAQAPRRSLKKDSWLLDSAASSHIVNNKSYFHQYQETPGKIIKGMGSASQPGRGTIKISTRIGDTTNSIKLKDVLYVPESPQNLICLAKIQRAGYIIQFPTNTRDVNIITPGGRKILYGRNVGDMYALGNVSPIIPEHIESSLNLAFAAQHSTRSYDDWHRIFGHIYHGYIKAMKEKKMVTGMEIDPSSTPSKQCTTCIQAKHHVNPFPKESQTEYREIGDMTYTDVWGPARTTGIHGELYYISFTDGHSEHTVVMFMKKKSEADEKIKQYREFIKTQHGKRCKAFRFDGGGEYISERLKKQLNDEGIRVEITAPYSPSQNGVAERLNRTLLERTRAMLIQHSIPKFLWPEAITYAIYLKNRSPTRALKEPITPYEAFWNKKPNVSQLQEFGINCWVLQQGEKPSKLDPKSRSYQFVGISEDSRAWRYYVPHSRKVLTSRNIIFEEQTNENPDEYVPIEPNDALPLEGEKENNNELEKHQENTEEGGDEPHTPTNQNPPPLPQTPTKPRYNPPPREQPARTGRDKSYSQFRLLRTQGNLSPARPDAWKHQVRDNDHQAYLALETEPQSFKEANGLPASNEWHKAMESELQLLKELGTFTVTKLPEGRKAIGSKWTYRIKRDDKGELSRRKARLVAQGFAQIGGIDYEINNTSSPVVRMETNRLLLALAARYDLEVQMIDVKGAYLNGKLDEEIYMKQPEGFTDGTDRVLKLHKTIYGLKQSGKVWNDRLNREFKKLNFQRLLSDQCVYTRRNDAEIIIVSVHVDDMAIYASNSNLITQTEKELEQAFEISRLGDIKLLLGMEVHRDRDARTITLSQKQYIFKILHAAGMENCNPVATPLDPNVKLQKLPDDMVHPEIQQIYQSLIGGLMYAAICTRPDIAYAVQSLSQFSSNPGPEHLTAAKRVYRYLKGTIDLGITYSGNNASDVTLYSDADWGNNLDDRRSISGYVSILSGGATTWSSKKQPTVALSSMEAEYMALANTVKENIWIRQLFSELGRQSCMSTPIFVDNRGTIEYTTNAGFHARSKHIDIRHHFIRDSIASHEASVHHCTSEENIADIFTKPLPRNKHEYLVGKLGMSRV